MKFWTTLVHRLLRPPRVKYKLNALGRKTFRVGHRRCVREDFTVCNPRGLHLECSLFRPADASASNPLPCVVYAHGNSGCRLEGLDIARRLVGNVSVCTFDFAGCGLSEGEFVSLGAYEKEDLGSVIRYLVALDMVSSIGVWGRSMGAVAALALCAETSDPVVRTAVRGLVLDSPFSDLNVLLEEIVHRHVQLPGFVASLARRIMRGSLLKRAGFDIDENRPYESAERCTLPMLIYHGEDDTMVGSHHSRAIFKHYRGPKNILVFPGGHNDKRPAFVIDTSAVFFVEHLIIAPQTRGSQSPSCLTSTSGPHFGDEVEDDDADDDVHLVLSSAATPPSAGSYPDPMEAMGAQEFALPGAANMDDPDAVNDSTLGSPAGMRPLSLLGVSRLSRTADLPLSPMPANLVDLETYVRAQAPEVTRNVSISPVSNHPPSVIRTLPSPHSSVTSFESAAPKSGKPLPPLIADPPSPPSSPISQVATPGSTAHTMLHSLKEHARTEDLEDVFTRAVEEELRANSDTSQGSGTRRTRRPKALRLNSASSRHPTHADLTPQASPLPAEITNAVQAYQAALPPLSPCSVTPPSTPLSPASRKLVQKYYET